MPIQQILYSLNAVVRAPVIDGDNLKAFFVQSLPEHTFHARADILFNVIERNYDA
jgi:hypothetical protein